MNYKFENIITILSYDYSTNRINTMLPKMQQQIYSIKKKHSKGIFELVWYWCIFGCKAWKNVIWEESDQFKRNMKHGSVFFEAWSHALFCNRIDLLLFIFLWWLKCLQFLMHHFQITTIRCYWDDLTKLTITSRIQFFSNVFLIFL